ncbi:MAG: hypothetical protein ACKN9R_02350 [Candidatus Limnocylindrus sp.]
MRPLVTLLALCALLFFSACQAGSGPSSAVEAQPALGVGLRVVAGPEGGVGVDARLDLGRYACRTGTAAEAPGLKAPTAPAFPAASPPCADGACPPATADIAP